MGQYYTAVNMDKRERLYSHSFGSGLKLMESSYVGNGYMEALSWLLANSWKGDRVLYCGDYAWDSAGGSACELLRALAEQDPFDFADECEDVSTRFASCKGHTRLVPDPDQAPDAKCRRYVSVPLEGSFDIVPEHYRYLANFDRMAYVDREKSPVAWVWRDGRKIGVTRYDPLPLYLAIGNGLGGGDFHGTGKGQIGSWAGQRVLPMEQRPEGLYELTIPFDEDGLFITRPDAEIVKAVRKHKAWQKDETSIETPELADLLRKAEEE